MNSIVIGTRGSPLALAQTNSIADQISHLNPKLKVAIEVIKTTGDRNIVSSLSALAQDTKGLFVKEIEEALLDGSIDLAVHSLKDVPTELPEGLCIGVTPEREEPWDALVSADPFVSLLELPSGARIGTSSPRRAIQLAERRAKSLYRKLFRNASFDRRPRGAEPSRQRSLHDKRLSGPPH